MESEGKFTFPQVSMLRLGRNNLMLELKAQISLSLLFRNWIAEIGALLLFFSSPDIVSLALRKEGRSRVTCGVFSQHLLP